MKSSSRLSSQQIVLCDRFNDSTLAYQGARGFDKKRLSGLLQFACNKITPDLTIYLDLDPEIGFERAQKGRSIKDRIESEELIFHQKIRRTFRQIAKKEPKRFVLIDAMHLPKKYLNKLKRKSMPFSKLLGNEIAKNSLCRHLEQKTMPHGLLFCGPDGVGKAIYALKVAECLMGPQAQSKLKSGNHCDLHQLFPEGKAGLHPIENMRSLIKEAALPPFEALAKIFILHDAHKMFPASSNALLKTLEEPTSHTYFILLTNHAESILPTVVSRLRKIPFFPIPDKEIEQFAQQQWNKEFKESQRIAFLSHGSFAKAYQLAHQTKEESHALLQSLLNLSLPQEYDLLFSLSDALEKNLYPTDPEDTNTLVQIDKLLEEIYAWYRDLHLLKSNKLDKTLDHLLYHFDAIHNLQKKAQGAVPSLEDVLNGLLTLQAALQRHVKLRVALEYFLLKMQEI